MLQSKGKKSVCKNVGDLRNIVGRPKISLHAAVRYAQRILGLEITEPLLLKNKELFDRCRNGIRRIYNQADQLILSQSDPAEAFLFCRHRYLLVKNGIVVTVIMKSPKNPISKAQLARLSRGRLPGIERINELLARKAS